MESAREHIYLAALLHDIGKFYQRADTGGVNNSKYLKEHSKNETVFCPQISKGQYSHKHVLWTAQFIEDEATVFNNLLGINLSDLENNLINLAAGHHLKKEQLSEWGNIIKEADCLSSGMDRESNEALKDAQDEEIVGRNTFKRKRMVSILDTIKNDKTVQYYMPLERLTLNEESFPKTFDKFTANPDYAKLWQEFVSEFKFIQANTYRAFSETFLNLLYRYTTSIPSSTINFPDVSLYDHLKTTAAIAVCLYDYYTREAKDTDGNPFLLIGGDFSGIQSYLYQIISKYAGKNLKGRSFYLHLLSDAIVRYLLKELRLFQANVIYNSGGSFYILAPNTQFTKEALSNAIRTIEKNLFDTHGTALYVAIDYIEVSKNALLHEKNENLQRVWIKLFEKRDKKKNSKFASSIKNNYSEFFEPHMRGGDAHRDSITDEEFLHGEKEYKVNNNRGNDLLLKQVTKQQIDLGEKLRDTNIIVVKEDDPLPYWNDLTHITPINLGFNYYFINEEDIKQKKELLNGSADKVSVITLNGTDGSCDFLHSVDGVNNIYGLEFYGGNEMGKDCPTFEEMCNTNDNSADEESFKRLGVLRMDVDNLGHIFQEGISPERATLSRYAALSRSLDYFFSGYLNTIWKKVAPEQSFIIYSGGDDVFIVGRWDKTIEIAKQIRDDFRKYTCHNPKFSLSGGIAILSPKYPIMKGAEESDIEEKNAKQHQCPKRHQDSINTKNSISFMDMPLNWEYEYPAVEKLKTKIIELLKGDLPKSFVSKILQHKANADIINHKITNYKTYWMLSYDLSRMQSRIQNKVVSEFIKICIKEVCENANTTLNNEEITTDYHPLELWAFAARWAELEYRTNKKK